MMKRKRPRNILVLGGVSRSLVIFRGHLLESMVARGHRVLACSGDPLEEVRKKLCEMGIHFMPVPLARTGMRPWEDVRTLWHFSRIMNEFQPDVILSYTHKPVIWGGLAARVAHHPSVYSLITGLGYVFSPDNGVQGKVAGLVASLLYRLSLKQSRVVFFQNPDDMQAFLLRRLVKETQCVLVNGSGVDLEHYRLNALPKNPSFLMICRLLADKGVREYVKAARAVRKENPSAVFCLAGALDTHPSSISQSELDGWVQEGVIDYLGLLEDVRAALAECSVYVLPSYREGTPRTVLEAMSMGRPIITTNAPGCRETVRMQPGRSLDKQSKDVIEGENGLLVPVKSVEKLVQAMKTLILHPELVRRMGRQSRIIAEEKYDVRTVNAVLLEAMEIM